MGPGGAGVDTTRSFAYAEYEFATIAAASSRTRGHLARESGQRGHLGPGAAAAAETEEAQAGWLRPFRLPNSSHVERALCAEFQVLSALCGVLAPQGGQRTPQPWVVGVVLLVTTTSPCLSCFGALRQFQLLFPEVEVDVADLEGGGGTEEAL